MAIFDFIDPFIFMLALAIGVMFTYIFQEEPTIVFKHPSPDNINNTVYTNSEGSCYRYEMSNVDCPSDDVVTLPVNQ